MYNLYIIYGAYNFLVFTKNNVELCIANRVYLCYNVCEGLTLYYLKREVLFYDKV